jgi:hypothetical protein
VLSRQELYQPLSSWPYTMSLFSERICPKLETQEYIHLPIFLHLNDRKNSHEEILQKYRLVTRKPVLHFWLWLVRTLAAKIHDP